MGFPLYGIQTVRSKYLDVFVMDEICKYFKKLFKQFDTNQSLVTKNYGKLFCD